MKLYSIYSLAPRLSTFSFSKLLSTWFMTQTVQSWPTGGHENAATWSESFEIWGLFRRFIFVLEKGRKKNIEEPCLNTKSHPWFHARQVAPSSSGSLMVNFWQVSVTNWHLPKDFLWSSSSPYNRNQGLKSGLDSIWTEAVKEAEFQSLADTAEFQKLDRV